MANTGILCQGCGIEAPTRHVLFDQNIGAFIMRFHSAVNGAMCKRCVHRNYWKLTMTTVAIGWCGTISLFLAPIYVIGNTVRYLGLLGMEPVPPGAGVPVMNAEVWGRIAPANNEMIGRLNQGEPIEVVAGSIAARVGVTPGQVVLFLREIVARERAQQMQMAQMRRRRMGFQFNRHRRRLARRVGFESSKCFLSVGESTAAL